MAAISKKSFYNYQDSAFTFELNFTEPIVKRILRIFYTNDFKKFKPGVLRFINSDLALFSRLFFQFNDLSLDNLISTIQNIYDVVYSKKENVEILLPKSKNEFSGASYMLELLNEKVAAPNTIRIIIYAIDSLTNSHPTQTLALSILHRKGLVDENKKLIDILEFTKILEMSDEERQEYLQYVEFEEAYKKNEENKLEEAEIERVYMQQQDEESQNNFENNIHGSGISKLNFFLDEINSHTNQKYGL